MDKFTNEELKIAIKVLMGYYEISVNKAIKDYNPSDEWFEKVLIQLSWVHTAASNIQSTIHSREESSNAPLSTY